MQAHSVIPEPAPKNGTLGIGHRQIAHTRQQHADLPSHKPEAGQERPPERMDVGQGETRMHRGQCTAPNAAAAALVQ